MKLLLIEDHQDIANIIFDFFEIKGYTLDYANNGLQGYELAKQHHYDLIILDIMLPRMDGYMVCQQLREDGIDTPILMLTARDTREDTLEGFATGADDYLIKPFDLEILEARITALTRRRKGTTATQILQFGDLSLDLKTHIATRENRQISLNPTLFTILKLMLLRAPNILKKQEVMNTLWGDDEPENNVLRSHIYQLRTQIDKGFSHSYIKTIPKVGYQLIKQMKEDNQK
ncbi:response regulator transcription factor [Photobacterium leiognathi]|uniref:response regulator transcription factor n=1 Tax=Photobacterium leiognathi TaxID=553611 RepID=UPI001EE0C884|nr:response regulator transcription factor [Photobacterium leiognathi]MCG3886968.1 response regulator transcription factor [Photobacterium leiognathi]